MSTGNREVDGPVGSAPDDLGHPLARIHLAAGYSRTFLRHRRFAMVEIGDLVEIEGEKVGTQPRSGLVVAVTGSLLSGTVVER